MMFQARYLALRPLVVNHQCHIPIQAVVYATAGWHMVKIALPPSGRPSAAHCGSGEAEDFLVEDQTDPSMNPATVADIDMFT